MEKRVLIVGLGIAGMSAAIRMKQIGWRPTIVERSPERRTGGYFIGLFAEGVAAAKELGIYEDLVTRTPRSKVSWEIHPDGSRVRGVGFLEQPGEPEAVLRGDIEAALWEAVDGKIDVRFNTVPIEISTTPFNAFVSLRDVATGERFRESYDLVIGADGMRSTVRELSFGPHGMFMKPFNAVICAYQLRGPLTSLEGDESAVVAQSRRSLWLFGMNTTAPTALFTYRTRDIDAQFSRPPVEVIRDVYQGMPGGGLVAEALNELENASQVLFDSVHQVRASTWHKERVVLLGDAGWCLTLYSGMGATSAMKGAVALGNWINRDRALSSALAQWERELRPFIEKHQFAAMLKAQIFVPSNHLAAHLRRRVIASAARTAQRKASTPRP